MKRAFLLGTLCLALAFAGCTTDEPGDDENGGTPATTTPSTTTPATSTPAGTTPATTTPATTTPATTTPATPTEEAYVPYTVELQHFPTAVEAGRNFSFVLRATGGVPATTNHLGAHYAAEPQGNATPSTTLYPGACLHVTNSTAVPGSYNVTCSVPSAGTWHFRGHVRIGAANDSWGPEVNLTVRPTWNATGNYTLNLTGVPTLVRVGQDFTMNLTMAGSTGLSSHFGAHYGNNSTAEPSTTLYPQACVHQNAPTTIPTTYQVTCRFTTAGVHYLRGHLLVSEGLPPANNHYWTGEYAIVAL